MSDNDRNSSSILLFDMLRSEFEELKSSIDNPRVYVSNYCDELRKRIDLAMIEMEMKPIAENKSREKLLLTQETMINETKIFEKDCYNELINKRINYQNEMNQFQNMITEIEQKIKRISDSMDISVLNDVNILNENCIANMKEKIFIKRGLVFMSSNELYSAEEVKDQFHIF